MADPEQLKRAQEELVRVVEEWARDKPWQRRELTPLEERLKDALYEVRRARAATGSIRVPDLGNEPKK